MKKIFFSGVVLASLGINANASCVDKIYHLEQKLNYANAYERPHIQMALDRIKMHCGGRYYGYEDYENDYHGYGSNIDKIGFGRDYKNRYENDLRQKNAISIALDALEDEYERKIDEIEDKMDALDENAMSKADYKAKKSALKQEKRKLKSEYKAKKRELKYGINSEY